jgi:hypothetical protein
VFALPIIGQIESRLELRKTSQFSNR